MLLSFYKGKENLIQDSKHAEIVKKNLMRKKILIGLAECINLNGEVKCGGVVVNEAKINLVANSVNMKHKTMMKTINIKIPLTQKKKNKKCFVI